MGRVCHHHQPSLQVHPLLSCPVSSSDSRTQEAAEAAPVEDDSPGCDLLGKYPLTGSVVGGGQLLISTDEFPPCWVLFNKKPRANGEIHDGIQILRVFGYPIVCIAGLLVARPAL